MLTKEQQETIENSLWIVNSILKQKNLQKDNDLRQSAILYMCKCILKFDTKRNTKWSTYAYKSVSLYIKTLCNKRAFINSKMIDINIGDLESICDNGISCFDIVAQNEFLSILSPKELEIWSYMRQGYSEIEISEILKCSSRRIFNIYKSIKNKARRIEK